MYHSFNTNFSKSYSSEPTDVYKNPKKLLMPSNKHSKSITQPFIDANSSSWEEISTYNKQTKGGPKRNVDPVDNSQASWEEISRNNNSNGMQKKSIDKALESVANTKGKQIYVMFVNYMDK